MGTGTRPRTDVIYVHGVKVLESKRSYKAVLTLSNPLFLLDTLSKFFVFVLQNYRLHAVNRQVFYCSNMKIKQTDLNAFLFHSISMKGCRLEIRNKYQLINMSLGVPESDIKVVYCFGVCLSSANMLFCSKAMCVGNS